MEFAVLGVRDLSVRIGRHEIVSIDELDLPAGRRLGLVGESGSGKTMTAMSLAGLAPAEARQCGSIVLDGHELVGLGDKQLARVRGAQMGVIFQDPLRALNPTMRIGRQIDEAVRLHANLSRAERRERVLELMSHVQLSEPERLVRRYPHQLSGGQRQRVLIAMAIASGPRLLIADEPTTALDVTVQKEILGLLVRLSEERQMALLFVSHDLGVVRAVCEYVAVLYGGRLVETGPVRTVIHRPRHRYTEALIGANPGHASADDLAAVNGRQLTAIPGVVPSIDAFPIGCRFRDRCAHAVAACADDPPMERLAGEHRFACFNPTIAAKEWELDGNAR
ncbi:ABC transporter ATP-binding protein [Phytoactinopolyspora halotolerans]|uniref:ABC transporter ATP-binding protein n=1 Tax=Phytoactinopolyspora halotolerans TaxID=1981512 RepID=A0A6L9SGY5_9ACTN|nr:ABC transporter ATP-binding protein [Phytoactinopolyspora halotolerans]NEE03904.1 ABC transporter ATP-binding protein [Phytoactinopolyspora halotolerans]